MYKNDMDWLNIMHLSKRNFHLLRKKKWFKESIAITCEVTNEVARYTTSYEGKTCKYGTHQEEKLKKTTNIKTQYGVALYNVLFLLSH